MFLIGFIPNSDFVCLGVWTAFLLDQNAAFVLVCILCAI